MPPGLHGGEVLDGFETPALVGPPDRFARAVETSPPFGFPSEITRAVGELARSRHTTINTVLQAAWAQLLRWLTGQHDVVVGTPVPRRPAEPPGADSLVGLLINTVPVRAHYQPQVTTTTDLLNATSKLTEEFNMNLIEWFLSLLFPPKLGFVDGRIRGDVPEDFGCGVIGRAKPKQYRDGIARYWAQEKFKKFRIPPKTVDKYKKPKFI